MGIDNGELGMEKWEWIVNNWELRFEKLGIWDLRVESWEQGFEKSESKIESGAGNADVGVGN